MLAEQGVSEAEEFDERQNSLRVTGSSLPSAREQKLSHGPPLDHNPWSERGQSPRTGPQGTCTLRWIARHTAKYQGPLVGSSGRLRARVRWRAA